MRCALVSWRHAGRASIVRQPTVRHAALMRGFLAAAGTAGNLTTDAHLAALSVEYGAAIFSYDADFSRFPGVSVTDPDHDDAA